MYTVVDRKKAYYGDTLKKSFSLISHLRLYIFHSYFNSYSSFYCRERNMEWVQIYKHYLKNQQKNDYNFVMT